MTGWLPCVGRQKIKSAVRQNHSFLKNSWKTDCNRLNCPAQTPFLWLERTFEPPDSFESGRDTTWSGRDLSAGLSISR